MPILSAYQFACGYVQTFDYGNIKLRMWKEHGVYHVRSHNHGTQTRLAWECAHTLTEARRLFSAQRRQIKTGKLY